MMSTLKSGRKVNHGFFPPAAKGQAAVEALLVLMILALVIFSGIELSQGVASRQALDSNTAAAVRALSLDPSQWAFATNLVGEAAPNPDITGSYVGISLKVYDAAGTQRSSAWLSGSPFGTTFILEATAPFQADIPFLTVSPITIRVRHWGIVERYP